MVQKKSTKRENIYYITFLALSLILISSVNAATNYITDQGITTPTITGNVITSTTTVCKANCDYIVDGVNDEVQIQQAIATAASGKNKYVLVRDNVNIGATIIVNVTGMRIDHLGDINITADNIFVYEIGVNGQINDVQINARNIEANGYSSGGIWTNWASVANVKINNFKNGSVAFYFQGPYHGEGTYTFNYIGWSDYGIFFNDSGNGAFAEGNEFLGGRMFNNHNGLFINNNSNAGFTYITGTIDNRALTTDTDYVNNMTSDKSGNYINVKYLRDNVTLNKFSSKDIIMMTNIFRPYITGLKGLGDVEPLLSTGRGATTRHFFFNTNGQLQYNTIAGDTGLLSLSQGGVTKFSVDTGGDVYTHGTIVTDAGGMNMTKTLDIQTTTDVPSININNTQNKGIIVSSLNRPLTCENNGNVEIATFTQANTPLALTRAGIKVDSDLVETTGDSLMLLRLDNSASSIPLLRLQNDGNGTLIKMESNITNKVCDANNKGIYYDTRNKLGFCNSTDSKFLVAAGDSASLGAITSSGNITQNTGNYHCLDGSACTHYIMTNSSGDTVIR